MSWWASNRLRLVQNNLREIDANLDVDSLIGQLKQWSVNVLMLNAGGIVAFYPTKLQYHYRAQGQSKDLLQEAIQKAHANGMKLIARFDFSKAHERIFQQKPEWFYRTREGKEVNYHGIVHTCINGYYQQEYSLQMIDEVISQYDVDGIFFNMFGYQNWDYSGNYYGTCFCDNCKARFREMFGLDLPVHENFQDPVYQAYKRFQDITTRQMLDRIYDLVKSRNKEIAISTYNEYKVDIVRKESNTALTRPHPVWLYSASENVKSLEDSWSDKLISNCCINAIDLFYRFTAVSPHEVNIRLKESLASGSGLDFCIIGTFDDYPDRENFEVLEQVFNYHKENEAYYGNFQSVADVALIKPGGPVKQDLKEYYGIFKMLKEQHILFDVIHQNNMVENEAHLASSYKAVIIPDIAEFAEDELQVLEELHRRGVSLVGTGQTLTRSERGHSLLQGMFGVALESEVPDVRAAYFKTENKALLKRFPLRDWIIVDGYFGYAKFDEQTGKLLPFLTPSTFGPPERAFGHQLSEYAGAGIRRNGKQINSYLPWNPGELYYKYGFADHKNVVLDVLDEITDGVWRLTTNAPHNVELFLNRIDDGAYMLHVLNLSGFNGVTYSEPLPVYGLNITLHGIGGQHQAVNLVDKSRVSASTNGSDTVIELPECRDFAAILIKKEQ